MSAEDELAAFHKVLGDAERDPMWAVLLDVTQRLIEAEANPAWTLPIYPSAVDYGADGPLGDNGGSEPFASAEPPVEGDEGGMEESSIWANRAAYEELAEAYTTYHMNVGTPGGARKVQAGGRGVRGVGRARARRVPRVVHGPRR